MSRFYADLSAEKELDKFLDEYLYPELSKDTSAVFRRERDRSLQMAGVDVTLVDSVSGATLFLDEKAALYYINKPLKTFAFELEYTKDGTQRRGWFINDGLKTDLYVLIWILSARTSAPAVLKAADIDKLECMFLRKATLRWRLDQAGLTAQTLLQRVGKMRRDGQTRQATALEGVTIVGSSSQAYSETPFNLVIGKHVLAGLAERHYLVTRTGLTPPAESRA